MLKGYNNLRGSFDIQKVVNNDFFLYLKTEGFRFRALPAEASAKAGSGLCQPKPRRRLVPGLADFWNLKLASPTEAFFGHRSFSEGGGEGGKLETWNVLI